MWSAASEWTYYGYNGFGMRVRRTQGGVTQRYLYDGADLLAEVAANGNPLRTYNYYPGIDQPHSMRSWSGTTPGALHYYALDLPGNNVQGLFNPNGTITHRYTYTPWGQMLVSTRFVLTLVVSLLFMGGAGWVWGRCMWLIFEGRSGDAR